MARGRRTIDRRALWAALGGAALALAPGILAAETLESALARAYGINPTLNSQRASVRAIDENVPRAKSGYRPRVTATADAGAAYSESSSPGLSAENSANAVNAANRAFLNATRGVGTTTTGAGGDADGGTGGGGSGGTTGGSAGGITASAASRIGRTNVSRTLPRGVGLQIDQQLFNGYRTENTVRQAESQVLGARETLRNTEQTVLIDGATAYMDVLRDTANVALQRNNIEVLDEQLRQTRDRFNVGEVTRTDVAQAEARLALARSQLSGAEATLRGSIARFRQVIGVEPRQLAPGRPVDRLVPGTLDAALHVGLSEHPVIKSAQHTVDAAELQVRIAEGELLPSVTVRGSAAQRYDTGQQGDERFTGSVVAQLSVPIYEGGEVYARVRQAKETAGQRRIEVEITRDQVRAAIITAWGALESAKAQIIASQAQVAAAETALNGVREEARVGQRTTLDVLNAQQELLNARVNLIISQRNRVVSSYQVVQAIGRLSTRALALNVEQYSARVHFDQVKDLWGGLRTPDGR